jgi:hypothetical protein
MRIDVSQGTGLADGGLVMIGHNSRQSEITDLLDHSAAKIRENNQIGTTICYFLQSALIKLPEEQGPVLQAAPIQGGADNSRCREAIRIHMRDDEKIFSLPDLLSRALA